MLRPLRRPPITQLWPRGPQPTTLFHTSSPYFQPDNGPNPSNHYETLQISPSSTSAQIKSQFYTLSKSYHPDHNRHDPNAANRFVQISEAYAVLGSPAKRERYDRDLQRQQHSATTTIRASTTTGPAGGRPASGLSRRRTQFKGPPPSFYRSGGWGAQYAKRARAQAQAQAQTTSSSGFNNNTAHTPFNDVNDVPHFDRDAHFRTHLSHEERWRLRRRRMMAEERAEAETGPLGSAWVSFFFVGGILAFVVGLPSALGAVVGREREVVFSGSGAGAKGRGDGG